MEDKSNNTAMFIDLIEPKFDPTHEVSRAMVEYNRFIHPFREELKNKMDGIVDIGCAVFNRRVWARANREGKEDKDDQNLLNKDHYIFSNLSSEFCLVKEDYGLFKSLLQSVLDAPIDEEYNGFLFDGIEKEHWDIYINELRMIDEDIAVYKNVDSYLKPIKDCLTELTASKSNFEKAFEDPDDEDKKKEIEPIKNELKKNVNEVLKHLVLLLRMPVLGGFPGTLTDVLGKNYIQDESMVYLAFSKNIKTIRYYCLRYGNIVEINDVTQRGMWDEKVGSPKAMNSSQGDTDNSSKNKIILTILTKLYQLFVTGPLSDLTHTIFLSVPIYKSYYPGLEKASGTIAGFLQGWIFIPIKLKARVDSDEYISEFITSFDGNDSLKDLIEGCLIAGNVLVEKVRSTGARRAVGQASVDDDDISALKNSVHHMAGWKVSLGVNDDEVKLVNEDKNQRWGDGTDKNPVVVRLGNIVEKGKYEINNSRKVIRLTKDDKSFVEPSGVLIDGLSGKDVYLQDLAQRLRTVHALILDKKESAEGKAYASMAMQEQALSHELGQVTGLLSNKYILDRKQYESILDEIEADERGECIESAKMILAGDIVEAAVSYVRLWAPPKTDTEWIDLIAGIEFANKFLEEVGGCAKKAGYSYIAKNLDAYLYSEHKKEHNKYLTSLAIKIDCASNLKFMLPPNSEQTRRSKELLFRAVAAACLNAIKHIINVDDEMDKCVYLCASNKGIWVINQCKQTPVHCDAGSRNDGDGSYKVLDSVCKRIPIDECRPVDILLDEITPDDMPPGLAERIKAHDGSSWFAAVFVFKQDTLMMVEG